MARKRLITVSPPQELWLIGEAKKFGIPVSELIRRIIDEYRIRKSQNELPKVNDHG